MHRLDDMAREAIRKIVEFDPRPYGTGTYKIKVKFIVPQTSGKMSFGIAWR